MTAGFAWLAALALLPLLAGAPLLAAPRFRDLGWPARAALSAAAGAAIVSFVMTVFSLAGFRWSPAAIVLVSLAVAAALRGSLRSPVPTAPPESAAAGRPTSAERLASSASAIAVAAAFAATFAGAATSPDLFLFWGPKAQQFAAARGIDVAYLADPGHAYMHAYYPPLAGNLGALAAIVAGRFSWTSATLTFPLLLAALAAALPGILRGAAGRTRAAAAAALAVTALSVVGLRANVAGNGDMPLLLFEGLATALLLRSDASDPAIEVLAGLLIAGAAAVKVEGLVFAIAAAACVLLRERPAGGRSRSLVRLLAPAAASLAAWFGFGLSRHLFSEYSEYGRFLDLHAEHAGRILSSIAGSLLATGHGLPYAVPLVALAAAGRPPRAAALPIGVAAVLTLFAGFAYLHLPQDPSNWINWSAPRVLAPLPLMFALAAAVSVRPEALDEAPA